MIWRLSGAALAMAFVLAVSVSAEPVAAFPTEPETNATADPRYNQALEAIDAEDYATAATLLKFVVQADPNNADAWSQYGFANRKQGRWHEGEVYYIRALTLDPDHIEAREYLGELYLETNRPDKAREQLAELQRLCPDGCEPLTDLEDAFATLGVALP